MCFTDKKIVVSSAILDAHFWWAHLFHTSKSSGSFEIRGQNLSYRERPCYTIILWKNYVDL